MRTVANTEEVMIEVQDSELIEGKWLSYSAISKKLSAMEEKDKLGYKALRNRLYNSCSCGKYNTKDFFGNMRCIDIENPMKGTASLKLNFKKV